MLERGYSKEQGENLLESLQEQICLSEDAWGSEFRELIQKKTQEAVQRNGMLRKLMTCISEGLESSPECQNLFTNEFSFEEYKNDLGLKESDLLGKRILDLGFGGGGFVKYLLLKKITSEAYGIDKNPYDEATGDTLNGHLLQGDFTEDFPVQNIDLIVSRQAIGCEKKYKDGNTVDLFTSVIEKSLAALKKGGEMRLPFGEEHALVTPDPVVDQLNADSREKWNKALLEISRTHDIDYKIEPTDINVYLSLDDDKSDKIIALNYVLIIRKK